MLHYKGVRFHRIVKDFVCQGGDVTHENGSGGESIYGKKFKDEQKGLKTKHTKAGMLGMCNSGKNSNTSQFYFTFSAQPKLDGKHVVFGQVVEGLEVLERVNAEAATKVGLLALALPTPLNPINERALPVSIFSAPHSEWCALFDSHACLP